MHTPLRFCIALGFLIAIAPAGHAKVIIQGTVSFLNPGSRPLAAERDTALPKAENQALDIANINLDKAIPTGYTIGNIAEDFALKNVDGNIVSLSDYKDAKGVIVIFTCNHCPFAQLYEQRIIDLHRMLAPKGFPVVAINSNSPIIYPEDSFEKMQERARQKRYPFAYLFDEEQTAFFKFGATRTPHVFVLDSERTVRYIGAIDSNPEAPNASTQRWLENAVQALLRGETPNPQSTKSIGCTVKKAPPPKSPVPTPNDKND